MIAPETVAASLVLGLAVAWVISYVGGPLLRRAPAGAVPFEAPPGPAGPERELQVVLTALRELEHDRELGLITPEDYAPRRAQHEARALVLYRELDELVEQRRGQIAAAVAAERARLSAAPTAPVEAAAAAPRPAARRTPDRARRIAIGSAAAAVLFLGGVGALWYGGGMGRGAQAPIATVRAPDYHVLAFDPASPSRVFLGTHAGLFVSGDRGQSWRPVPTAAGDVMAVVPVPSGLLAAGHDVLLSSPDGSNWQPATSSLPGTDVHAMAASPATPGRLYAAVVGHGLLRSDDAGRTWGVTGQMPPSIAALAVVPDGEGDILFAATAQEGVLASRDAGRTWANASGFVNGALPTRQVTAIAYDGRSGDVSQGPGGTFRGALFIATDQGVFRSTDGGSSWVRLGLNAPVATLAIAPDDPRTLLAIDAEGRVYRSQDRGVTW